MNEDLFLSAEWLRAENNHGYVPLPITQPRDHQIAELLKTWMKSDEANRKQTALRLSSDQGQTLLAFSERMASLAVRQKDEDLLILGLVALGIDGGREDWRENVLVISLHFDAARRIGSDPKRIFEAAANFLCEKSADGLLSFLRRSEHDQSIDAMGYVATEDSGGFRYKRTW